MNISPMITAPPNHFMSPFSPSRPPSHSRRLGLVGGGRAAWAFASAWRQVGWPLSGVFLRPESPSPLPTLLNVQAMSREELAREADVILIATPDRVIAETAAAFTLREGLIFHASGSLPSSILPQPERAFSLHPLRALPASGETVSLTGTLFVFEGGQDGESLATDFTEAVGASLLRIAPEAKPQYHAAAVFASNYVATLLELAERLMREAGLDDTALHGAVSELARSAIENWFRQEGLYRFTGPIVRGDSELTGKHLEALEHRALAQELYRLLGLQLVESISAEQPDSERLRAVQERLLQRR